MTKEKQFTFLDTELSMAVDGMIQLINERKIMEERFDDAVNNLKTAMDKAKKPEIIHIKGFEFKLDYKAAEIKLKIKKPKTVQ